MDEDVENALRSKFNFLWLFKRSDIQKFVYTE